MRKSEYYINDRLIVTLHNKTDKKIISMKSFSSYIINDHAYQIIDLITECHSFPEICQKVGISSEIDKDRLSMFLETMVKKGILSHIKNENAKLCKRFPTTSTHLERIFMEVTAKCNFRCKHCYMSADSNVDTSEELTVDEIKKIICQAEQMGVYRMDFTGGELLIKPKINEILQFASEHNMITNIFTNGYALTEEYCDFIAKLGNIRIVFISLDDDVAEGHDNFRRMPGSFDRIIQGIKYLKKRKIKVVINITINNNNADHICRIIDYCRNTLEVECRVAPILYVGRGKCFLDNKITQSMVVETMKYSIGDLSVQDISAEKENEPGCGVGHSMIYIRSNGEICLCPTLSSRESENFDLGNIRKDNIEYIWENSTKLKNFRASKCYKFDCKYRKQCRGGCRSRAFLREKNINDVDELVCQYFETNK